jgi:uncharacterized membrane protein
METKTKLQYAVMILCFVYAGISLILLVYQSYSLATAGQRPYPMQFQNMTYNGFSEAEEGQNMTGRFNAARRTPFAPIELIASSSGLVISILAGFSLIDLLKKKEKKELTKKVIDTMLMPEEKKVVGLLEENSGEMTQSELVARTKLSKVKISRVIKRLESLKIVSKFPYGMTNKIKLERRIFESK